MLFEWRMERTEATVFTNLLSYAAVWTFGSGFRSG